MLGLIRVGVLLATLVLPVSGVTLEVGDLAPDFSLPSLKTTSETTDTIALSAYRGKVVFVDFWDSWCAPCRRAMPELARLRASLSTEDFEVIGVNLDIDPADGRRFLTSVPVAYPVVSDPTTAVARAFDLAVLPSSFILDRSGRVAFAHQGYREGDLDLFADQINAVLSSK